MDELIRKVLAETAANTKLDPRHKLDLLINILTLFLTGQDKN